MRDVREGGTRPKPAEFQIVVASLEVETRRRLVLVAAEAAQRARGGEPDLPDLPALPDPTAAPGPDPEDQP